MTRAVNSAKGVSGYGGIREPDLSGAEDRITRAEMITRVYSGAANMPSYSNNLKPDELNALPAFLQSRHRAYKYKISPPTVAESRYVP